MGRETKFFPAEVKSFDDKTMTITHFISTEGVDRSGDVMHADGLTLDGTPSVLKQHGFDPDIGSEPIAKCLELKQGVNEKGDKGIIAKTKYFDGSKLTPPDNTGQRLYQKAKDNYMPFWSVAFIVDKATPRSGGGRDVLKWLCVEYSQVGVPDNVDAKNFNPETDATPEYTLIGEMEHKGTITYKKHPLSDEKISWDGPKEIKKAEVKDLMQMCTFFSNDGENKEDFNLPHHMKNAYKTVWKGVAAAVAVIKDARGGKSDMTTTEKKRALTHLFKHYADFGKDVPELDVFFDEDEMAEVKALPEMQEEAPAPEPDKTDSDEEQTPITELTESVEVGDTEQKQLGLEGVETFQDVKLNIEGTERSFLYFGKSNEFLVKPEDKEAVEAAVEKAGLVGLKSVGERVATRLPMDAMYTVFFAYLDELWLKSTNEKEANLATKEMAALIGPYAVTFVNAMQELDQKDIDAAYLEFKSKLFTVDPTPVDTKANTEPSAPERKTVLSVIAKAQPQRFEIDPEKISTAVAGVVTKSIRELTGKLD